MRCTEGIRLRDDVDTGGKVQVSLWIIVFDIERVEAGAFDGIDGTRYWWMIMGISSSSWLIF